LIIFENAGELDLLALLTFGVSAKESENPIGMFGTGFKYAAAVILRNGGTLSVWIGEEEHRFGTERIEVRNRTFDFLTIRCVNTEAVSTRLNFTTELGKNWEPWMAYRELYCNTKDEGGDVYTVSSAAQATDPRRGLTQFRVTGADLEDVHTRAAEYFLEGAPDIACESVHGVSVEVYRRPSDVLFYRGVRVLKLPQPARLTYNLLGGVTLTEDRTMAHPFMAAYYLSRALAQCDDPVILEAALTATGRTFEADFTYHDHDTKPGEAFLATAGRLSAAAAPLVESARLTWRTRQPATFTPRPIAKLSPEQHLAVRQVHAVLDAVLAVSPTERPIRLVVITSLDDGATAKMVDDCMYVAATAVGLSDAMSVVKAILREYISEEVGLAEESRERETWLIDQLVGVAHAGLSGP
jgi:hypothetical protein